MPSTMLLAALKVLILAGGGAAEDNHHSHKVHVDALLDLLEQRGVPPDDVAVFWADGVDPAPDRAVLRDDPLAESWRIAGTRLESELSPAPTLENTVFEGGGFAGPVQPASRLALQGWLARQGPQLTADDTLLIAVTDHGEPDPTGGTNTSISLWGEHWTVGQMAADLAPVPQTTRVVLWMSQCFSGGFAELHHNRPNLCGAFSAHPDRPAYGCYPELAERTDVGHFQRMVAALERHGSLATAHDEVLLTDDTPDTPHLTSDVMLFEALDEQALARGRDVARALDGGLPRDAADPLWARLSRLAARYGLGAVRTYGGVLKLIDDLDRARYALGVWRGAWSEADGFARTRIAEPLLRVLRPARDGAERRRQQARAIAAMGELIAADSGLAERVRRLRSKVEQADALAARIDLQEAAAIRAAYLLVRLVGPGGLSAAQQARYAALQRCESTPLWPPAPTPSPVLAPAHLPPVSRVAGEVEALRPGWLGLTYRDAPRHRGVLVERFEPGSPALAGSLAAGDRIVAVNDAPIRRDGAFREAALLARPGERVALTVRRRGARGRKGTEEVPLVVAPMPLPVRPPGIGQPVPALGLTPLDALPGIGQGRRTLLFFWEPACKPCIEALPALAVWADAFDADVIAITDAPPATVRRFVRRRGLAFPVAFDETGEARRLFAVERRPVFALIGPDGALLAEGEGYTDRIPLPEPAVEALAPPTAPPSLPPHAPPDGSLPAPPPVGPPTD